MFRSLPVIASNTLFAASCLRSRLAFATATRSRRRVARTQEDLLTEILRRSEQTEFGRKYWFHGIKDAADYRRNVPLSDYADYEAYMERIAAGTADVLTPDTVEFLQPSGGSTAATKYIPFTPRVRTEFMRGVQPWLFDLYSHKPGLLFGPAYWAITPAGKRPAKDDTGTRIGFDEDSGYFGALGQWLLQRLLVVPGAVAEIESMPVFQYVTLRFLLARKNLRLISIWNPSFLTLLLRRIPEWADVLASDVDRGTLTPPEPLEDPIRERLTPSLRSDPRRCEELRRIFGSFEASAATSEIVNGLGSAIWPHMRLLSCWCDGDAGLCLPDLRRLFPVVEIQPKGLLATEGIVSFPLVGSEGGPLAVRSHFFEFLPREPGRTEQTQDASEPLLAHELEAGREYSVVITTGGGLYRYRLYDLIRVTGYNRGVPLVRFVSKEDLVSDVAGEKLNAVHIRQVMEEVAHEHLLPLRFVLLAPQRSASGETRYVLFVQVDPGMPVEDVRLKTMAVDVDSRLRQNFHYDYCRRLGQLRAIRVYLIDESEPNPAEKCLVHLSAAGRKLGVVKPSILQKDLNWSAVFSGHVLE